MPSSSESHSEFVFRLPRRALRIAGMAFGIGLLLFVIVLITMQALNAPRRRRRR